MGEFFALAFLSAVSVVLYLFAEWRESQLGRSTLKLIASAGFVGAAVVMGALGQTYGRILLAGLGFSWLGDILLLSRGRRQFQMGLASFLLAHVAFSLAFLTVGHAPMGSALTFIVVGMLDLMVIWRLMPGVPREMRAPVVGYVVVISVMVSLAMGAFLSGANFILVLGAVTFYLSDLFVARDRFLSESFVNSLVGIPLYYAAQFMLAYSVSTLEGNTLYLLR